MIMLDIQLNNVSRSYKKYLFKKYWQAKCKYAAIYRESKKGVRLQMRIAEIAGLTDLITIQKAKKNESTR